MSRVPTLLHTCSDSRRVTTEYGYVLAFSGSAKKTDGRVWFNTNRDVLYLPQLLQEVDTKTIVFPVYTDDFDIPLKNSKRVAIRADLHGHPMFISEAKVAMRCFPVIEEFFVVLAHCGQRTSSALEREDNEKDP